jgi:hypothetical protein
VKGRSNGPGLTISQYAGTREISKWKAGIHRDLPAFPEPIDIRDGVRALRYYDVEELDDYFRSVEGADAKYFVFREKEGGLVDTRAGAGRMKVPDSLAHTFIFNWTEECGPGQIAED